MVATIVKRKDSLRSDFTPAPLRDAKPIKRACIKNNGGRRFPSSAACLTWERIYFFFFAGAFFLAAFFAGAFFLAAFLAGAFFLAVANSLTSFQVFFETTSFSFMTAKRKTLYASYARTQLFSIPFFHDIRLSIVAQKNGIHGYALSESLFVSLGRRRPATFGPRHSVSWITIQKTRLDRHNGFVS